jgi:hypothetical protein
MQITSHDRLIYREREYHLDQSPLEAYLLSLGRPIDLFGRCAAWRGYVATWTVDDGWLFLTSIAGSWADGSNLRIEQLFPVAGVRAFAAWHSGRLHAFRSDLPGGSQAVARAPDLTLDTFCGRIQSSSMIHRPKLRVVNGQGAPAVELLQSKYPLKALETEV